MKSASELPEVKAVVLDRSNPAFLVEDPETFDISRADAHRHIIYPMLDDRTATRADSDGENHRGWNHGSNVVGWTSYLGQAPGRQVVPEYAAPARREGLSGLPPMWMGVGTCDLFHDEDLAYARRL